MNSLSQEFLTFLKKHSVIGLAIAVIIGGKLNELVSSIVNDLFMPLLFQPALKLAQVDDIKKLSYNGVLYGKVLGSAIDFLIVAGLIFLFSKFVMKESKSE